MHVAGGDNRPGSGKLIGTLLAYPLERKTQESRRWQIGQSSDNVLVRLPHAGYDVQTNASSTRLTMPTVITPRKWVRMPPSGRFPSLRPENHA
jgi:hypothetical protein